MTKAASYEIYEASIVIQITTRNVYKNIINT